MRALGIVADVLMVVGGARLTVALLGPLGRGIARMCAGSRLDHTTRRIATWVLR